MTAPISVGRPSRTPQQPQLSTASMSLLRSELKRQPEIRPEVVERAKALAADPNYPSFETLRHVAQQILRSPDLSEDQS